jgi:hypothetical protein
MEDDLPVWIRFVWMIYRFGVHPRLGSPSLTRSTIANPICRPLRLELLIAHQTVALEYGRRALHLLFLFRHLITLDCSIL